MAQVEFCFRIEKEAGMAHDVDTGEPSPCLSKVGLDLQVVPKTEEEYEEIHYSIRLVVAKQLKIDASNIVPISYKEYQEEHEED